MADCCQQKSCDLEKLSAAQSKVLWIVLAINAAMFVVEFGSGILARSTALTGDSLDMFGDAVAYGSSLYVIRRGAKAKACLWLLSRHRNDDINMSSVWLCSRNDIIANVSVLAAAGMVRLTSTVWPDLIVGVGITILFAKSAFRILRQATRELRTA